MESYADRYYKPSGAVPLLGTILMQVFGTAAAFLLGGIYAAANYYSPHFILTGLAVLVFGAGVGFAINLGARIGKVRNPGFVMLLGTATGLLAVYFSWVFYIFLYWRNFGVPFAVWAWDPVVIYHNLQEFADLGIWQMESWTPTGWVLYAFWAIEAAVVVLLSLAVSVANDAPYCDHCNAWTTKDKDVASFALTDEEQLKNDLQEDRYEVLDALAGQPKDPRDCLKAVIHSCPNCEDSDYLTINHTRIVTSDDSETTHETAVVKYLHISRDLADHLRDLGNASLAHPVMPELSLEEEV